MPVATTCIAPSGVAKSIVDEYWKFHEIREYEHNHLAHYRANKCLL